MSRAWFGEFELDETAPALWRGGAPVKIQPKPLAMLVHLLRNRERVVTKTELLRAVWPGVSVSDQALFSALRDLRRALGDAEGAQRTICTLRGRGFRFVAEVTPPAQAGRESAACAAQPPAPARGSDFVDRDTVMAALRESLGCAGRGETRVSFIAGAAGMGKTRLALELSHEARSLGFEVRMGRCFDREGAAPFWPWLQVLRSLLTAETTAPTAQRVQAELADLGVSSRSLVAVARMPEHADLDRAEQRFRFFDAAAAFLQRVSEVHPLLICIDDLHWADEASLLLLEFLMTSLHGAPIHLLAAFRDPPRPAATLARVLAVGARQPFTERIELRGLGREAVGTLLARAGAEATAPGVVDAVIASTAGNPLFVTELAKLAADGQLDVARLPRALPVPSRVRDVLRWQFERLPAPCQRILQLLSAVGSELELSALTRAARTPRRAVLNALSEAEAVGFVVARHEQTRFAFKHDLVRESIYRDLSIAERTRLHRAIAQALEAEAGQQACSDASQIAYHYAQGAADGVAEQALHYNRLAGQQANARMAYEDAVVHYDRALRALALLGDPQPKVAAALLLSQAEASWGTLEDVAVVQRRFVAAADAARAAGEAELFARAALGRSGHRAGPGDFRDISVVDEVDVALLSEAESSLGDAETELRALVLARLSIAIREGREFAVAEALSREAVRIAEKIGAQETLAETLRYRHEVLSGPRFAHERLAIARRIRALAEAVRSRPLELDALVFESRDCFKLLDGTGGWVAGEAATALAATMKHPGARFRAGHRVVIMETLVGRFDDAERHAREFYERDASRHLGAAGTFDLQLYLIAMLRGDHRATIKALRRMGAGNPHLVWIECALARAYALTGRHDEAELRLRAVASSGYVRLEDHHTCLGSYLHLAEVCAELGDTARAADLYERLSPYEHLLATPFLCTIWQETVAHGLGVLATALERWDRAQQHFERALAAAEALKSPTLAAPTLERHGTMLLLRGRNADRPRAAQLLRRAAEIGERTGMREVVLRCERSQRRLKPRRPCATQPTDP